MDDPKMVEAQPVTALMIGTGDAGTPKTQLIETPPGQPDILMKRITPLIALLARAGSVFFTTMSGQIGAGAIGVIHGQTWQDSALISASAAAAATIWSLATIFGNLEKRYPILRA
jgi:hypothetical protein